MGEIEKSHTFTEPRKKEETECLDVCSSFHIVYSQALELPSFKMNSAQAGSRVCTHRLYKIIPFKNVIITNITKMAIRIQKQQ